MLDVNSMCIYGCFPHNAPRMCSNKAVLYVDSRRIEWALSPKSTFWLCSRSPVPQLKLLFFWAWSVISVFPQLTEHQPASCFVTVTIYWFTEVFHLYHSWTQLLKAVKPKFCWWYSGTIAHKNSSTFVCCGQILNSLPASFKMLIFLYLPYLFLMTTWLQGEEPATGRSDNLDWLFFNILLCRLRLFTPAGNLTRPQAEFMLWDTHCSQDNC